MMNSLVIGSGGREQAIAWKVAQSPLINNVFIAPGNGAQQEKCSTVALHLNNFEEIAHFIKENDIQLVVIGPEQPLVEGIVDYLHGVEGLEKLHIVGPSKAGAMLEGSKDFAKAFMERYEIPTAKYRTFTNETLEEGLKYLETEEKAPYVLKADGLAAGKGVVILDTLEAAQHEMREMLGGKFGSAGSSVVVETYLSGIECSVFVLTDGEDYILLPCAKDYKRIGEGDTGLNTGGMGAVSPVPFANDLFIEKVEECIIKPTIQGIQEEGIDYKGFIFIGLMNVGGDPYVIEYNCRMGDPETEVVMPRIGDDLVPAFLALRDQRLKGIQPLTLLNQVATTVVAVAGGYPESYEKGMVIEGLDEEGPHTHIFHMGTKQEGEKILTNGGRVLAVTALGDTLPEALNRSYKRLDRIKYDGMTFRKDIGQDLLKL